MRSVAINQMQMTHARNALSTSQIENPAKATERPIIEAKQKRLRGTNGQKLPTAPLWRTKSAN